jgi:phenylalanyl-tRNA synthetase beta chain
MKISEKWLREWVNPALNGEQLAEQLTTAGLEVDAYTPVAPAFNNVVVGFVKSAEPHPNANKLTICQVVIDSKGTETQIICGASNARPNIKVAAALPGAVLPNGLTIAARELRGVQSGGMLCAADEIGLAEESNGIMELPEDAPVGTSIRDYLQLDDHIIEVDLTPNRGDCLSVIGLSREVAALNRLPLPKPAIEEINAILTETKNITITASQGCPRYVGRIIRGIDPQAKSPIWMQERLRRAGIRSVSVVVDVTNYVLMELGQPMHAFDLNRLSGDIVVRWAKANEKLITLDDKEVTLSEDVLTIADNSGAIAMAGIMGGKSTAINDQTTDIFLESAFFAPLSTLGRARRFGLHTDSSQRFERGVDPTLQNSAMERATQLIIEIAGGQPGPISEVVNTEDSYFQPRKVSLEKHRLNKILGTQLSEKEIVELLNHLGIVLENETPQAWQFVIPSHRFDITIAQDLIEEVARLYGYHNIRATMPVTSLKTVPKTDGHILKNIQNVLIERGYHEAITYSFIDPTWHDLFSPTENQMQLLNPISQEMSVMRYGVIPGLLNALKYNLARQQARVRLFETGLGFSGKDTNLKQISLLGGVACGDLFPLQWSGNNKEIDFFDIKNDVEQLVLTLGLSQRISYVPATKYKLLHPGQSAEILCDDKVIGYVGMAHPGFLQQADIKTNVGIFELYLDEIPQAAVPKCKDISSFPSIRRDIALLVDRNIPVASLKKAIGKVDTDLLQNVTVFDIYEGKGIAENQRSIAMALFIQHATRTLTDDEINTFMNKVLKTLETEFQARLRD